MYILDTNVGESSGHGLRRTDLYVYDAPTVWRAGTLPHTTPRSMYRCNVSIQRSITSGIRYSTAMFNTGDTSCPVACRGIFTARAGAGMSRVFAFMSRLVVFGIITAVGFTVIPTEDMLVDRSLRLSISALQVLVLAGLYCTNALLTTVMHGIRQASPTRFARIDDKRDSASTTSARSTPLESYTGTAPTDKTTPTDDTAPTDDTTPTDDTAPAAAPEVAVDMDIMSLDSSIDISLPDSVVTFETQRGLDMYVMRVHLVGLALWQTFLTFDCTSRDIDICFITGLVVGWFYESTRQWTWTRLLLVSAYTGVIVTLVLSEQHVFVSAMPASDYLTTGGRLQLYFNICILPFGTGVFWVVAAHTVGSEIVLDARRSVVTFLLISLTYPLYWTRIDLAMVQAFLVKLPHTSILTIMLLSPVFKCISIYIMLVSLQRRHTLDLIIALAIVLSIGSAALYGFDTINIVRASLTCLLLAVHLGALNCTSCKHLALR